MKKKKDLPKKWMIFTGIGIILLVAIILISLNMNKEDPVSEPDNSTIIVEDTKEKISIDNLQAMINMESDVAFQGSDLDDVTLFELQEQYNTKEQKNCIADGSYHGLKLVIWTRFNEFDSETHEIEEITCDVEELYDGVLNDKVTKKYDAYKNYVYEDSIKGVSIPLNFEVDKSPEKVVYSITCTGETSEKSFVSSEKLEIEYAESRSVPLIWC